MGFLKSDIDVFQSESAREHFPLDSTSTYEKTRWKDLLTKTMQEKNDHIEELFKILKRNMKNAQKAIRDLVEVYRDETNQRVNLRKKLNFEIVTNMNFSQFDKQNLPSRDQFLRDQLHVPNNPFEQILQSLLEKMTLGKVSLTLASFSLESSTDLTLV